MIRVHLQVANRTDGVLDLVSPLGGCTLVFIPYRHFYHLLGPGRLLPVDGNDFLEVDVDLAAVPGLLRSRQTTRPNGPIFWRTSS